MDSGKKLLDGHAAAKSPCEGEDYLDQLRSTVASSIECLTCGLVIKIEAILVQANKLNSRASQCNLIQSQMAFIAGSELVQEAMVQPVLMAWSKAALEKGEAKPSANPR